MQTETGSVRFTPSVTDRAVYLRIDTAGAQPYFESASAREIVVTALHKEREKGWFDLLGFVVMPKELEIMFVPRKISTKQLAEHLEAEIYPYLSALSWIPGKVFDPDFYQERIECSEDIRQRKRLMHLAPVKAGLAPSGSTYAFCSANPRYREMINTQEF